MSLILFLLVCSLLVKVDAVCPNWCNQRGICSTQTGGDGECICDNGFTGDDCSHRLCPMTYDPILISEFPNRRTVRLQTQVEEGALAGLFRFSFAGSNVLLNADALELDDFYCTNSLAMGLKSISEVTCQRESFDPAKRTGSYLISIRSFPLIPFLNNVIYHTGNPPLSFFECNLTKINSEAVVEPSCTISDVVTENLPEYLPCGGHGSCDRVKGVCICHSGYKGKACEDTRDYEDLNVTVHHGPFFTGSMMKLQIYRSESSSFNLFQAKINEMNVTTIRGDRSLEHKGNVSIEGGRLTLRSASFSNHLYHKSPTNAQIQTFLSNRDEAMGSAAISHHWAASYDDQTVFSVDRRGNTRIEGSLLIGNTIRAEAEGDLSAQRVEVRDSLRVQKEVSVGESLSIGDSLQMTSNSFHLSVKDSTGGSMKSELVRIESEDPEFRGSVLTLSSRSDSTLLRASSNGLTTFELSGDGNVTMIGLQLKSGGIDVENGGISVQAGGLSVRGGITLESGELSLPHRQLQLGSLDLSLAKEELVGSLIAAKAQSPFYSGKMIHLTGPATNDSKRFSFLSLSKQSDVDESVFEVNGEGFLTSSAGAMFKGAAGVSVDTSLAMKGNVYLKAQTVLAKWIEASDEWLVEIPFGFSANYLIVSKLPPSSQLSQTQKSKEIKIVFVTGAEDEQRMAREAGRVLIITNKDSETTSGSLLIPPGSSILCVFNGERWLDIEALRAPMQVLRGVQRLEARNDLAIGNVSFSAAKFQATALQPGSVVYVGKNQFLAEHRQKFFYSKGVLHAPALKIDRLVGGLDGQGHDIQNLLLTNPKLNNANIQASELSLSSVSGGGLAYFSSKGQLLASKAMQLDEDNHLLIRELYSDIKGQDHTISHININEGRLQGIEVAEISRLRLFSTKLDLPPSSDSQGEESEENRGSVARLADSSHVHGAIIGVDSRLGGDLLPLPTSHLRYNFSTGDVSIDRLAVRMLKSPLNANNQEISHAKIVSSTFSDIKSLSVEDLVIESFRTSGGDRGSRLVYTDSEGRLQTYSNSESEISIPNLTVTNLHFVSPVIDFKDKVLANVRLDGSSVKFEGKAPELSVQSLVIEGNQVKNQRSERALELHDKHFLFSANDGAVMILPGLTLNDQKQVIDTSRYGIKTVELETEAIRFSEQSKANLEVVDNTIAPLLTIHPVSGKVAYGARTSLKELSVQSKLILHSEAEVIFEEEKRSSASDDRSGLLGVDKEGKLVKISVSLSEKEDQQINARFHLLQAHSLDLRDHLKTKALIAEEVILSPAQDEFKGDIPSGWIAMLGVDGESGRLRSDAMLLMNPSDQSIHVKSLRPLGSSSSDRLLIHTATLEAADINHSIISDAPSISTNRLTVQQQAEFQSDVTIMASVAVYGTVSGAGPYIDTSDLRFKKNIRPIHQVLDIIDQLQAVRYDYKQEEDGIRGFFFPTATQIGWIAQEVKEVLPEIVFQQSIAQNENLTTIDDQTSYLSIAYSHACPLLAEGIKELRQKVDVEMTAMRNQYEDKIKKLEQDIQEIREILRSVKSK